MNTPRRLASRLPKSPTSLLLLALLTNGILPLLPLAVRPAMALGTAADTPIRNRATATYEDPNNPPGSAPLNATSNEVVVTVARVAGITVANNDPPTNLSGGTVTTGNTLEFNFVVTNVGNFASNIKIPGASNLATQGLDPNSLIVEVDLTGNGVFTPVPAGGFTTTNPISADGSVRVRVRGVVTANTVGAPITVQLGNTPNPNNPAGPTTGQNQPSDDQANNVQTVQTGAAPVNGQREAAAISSTTLGSAVPTLALARVLKSIAAYAPQNTNVLTDDLITYQLTLEVLNAAPAGSNVTPGTLTGTPITLDNATATRIIVSDAIPDGTVLDAAFTITPPQGWQVVYSSTPTVIGSSDTALTAQWVTAPPTTQVAANNVRRIGFIFNGTLAPGSIVAPPGFQFRVITANVPAGTSQVNNIGQVFGQTLNGPANQIVFDESGDQRPNNFNDDGSPGAPFNPSSDNGRANPAVQGQDPGGNTGTGPAGEALVVPLNPPPGTILNGPLSQPGAVGPTNNNDDFTNRSSTIQAGESVPGSTLDPQPIVFRNTFQNPPTSPGNLSDVKLVPLPPNDPSVPANSQQPAADIPPGTKVTIIPDGQPSYTFTYQVTNGVGSYILDPGQVIPKFDNITPGTSINYNVSIDLPPNTSLSADRFTANGTNRAGFAVPIAAFSDGNNDNRFDSQNDPTFNLTLNRAYTGYVRLLKESRILDANGNQLEAFTQTPQRNASPGEIIEYRITYLNFSVGNSGPADNNSLLNANNLTITEDGASGTNNWATFTAHVPGSAADSGIPAGTPPLGVITYFSNGNSSTTDPGASVTRYIDTLSRPVGPGESGTFTFRRKVNN